MEQGIDGIILHAMDTSKSSVEKFGMKPLFALEKAERYSPGKHGNWCSGTFEDFKRLRSQYLEKLSGSVYWEERELRFIYEDLCRDGKLYFYTEEDGLHYGILSDTAEEICIEETDCESGLTGRLVGKICVYRPGQGIYGAHVKMYEKSLQEQDLCKLYFNLMLK